jgi:hypothetical protein
MMSVGKYLRATSGTRMNFLKSKSPRQATAVPVLGHRNEWQTESASQLASVDAVSQLEENSRKDRREADRGFVIGTGNGLEDSCDWMRFNCAPPIGRSYP